MEIIPINGERWLICGGRDFTDRDVFNESMNQIMRLLGCPSSIIHGCAPGADAMAGEFANRLGIDEIRCPANWTKHRRAAGPIRNREMLNFKPSKIIAFPGGKGTLNMISQARKAGIEVVEVTTGADESR